jgi:serine/threonine-protein kinase
VEHVDGEPIDAWCDAHRLDLDARLALFPGACEAVDYAHRHLVVPRDIKPAKRDRGGPVVRDAAAERRR